MLIQAVGEPFMSEHIDKGARSINEISAALEGTKVGIVCLAPENLNAPWILYEAGALTKTVDDETRLCTYLLGGLKRHEVPQPLGMFHATAADREDTLKLVHTINSAVGDEPLPKERVNALFDRLWPEFEEKLKSIPKSDTIVEPKRTLEDMVEEILATVRTLANTRREEPVFPKFEMLKQLMATGAAPASSDLARNASLPMRPITSQVTPGSELLMRAAAGPARRIPVYPKYRPVRRNPDKPKG
jgi:hypothetical protein